MHCSYSLFFYFTCRFVRNPNRNGGDLCVYETSELNLPKDRYTPCPVKKGSLVVFDGLTIHQSDINRSDKSRYAYTVSGQHEGDAKRFSSIILIFLVSCYGN